MECAYYFVDGTWNVPTTLTFVGCVTINCLTIPDTADYSRGYASLICPIIDARLGRLGPRIGNLQRLIARSP